MEEAALATVVISMFILQVWKLIHIITGKVLKPKGAFTLANVPVGTPGVVPVISCERQPIESKERLLPSAANSAHSHLTAHEVCVQARSLSCDHCSRLHASRLNKLWEPAASPCFQWCCLWRLIMGTPAGVLASIAEQVHSQVWMHPNCS